MKCSGDPAPCERCAKFGRECVFETVSRDYTGSLQSPLTLSDQPHNSLDRIDQDDSRPSGARKRSFHESSDVKFARKAHCPPPRYAEFTPEVPTAYSTVQELEERHLWPRPHSSSDPASSRCSSGGPTLASCLADAQVSLAEAREMFALFGERMAVYIPSFYATDFGSLPAQPVFTLAAIYIMVRYLPDSLNLRTRVGRVLRRLLADLLLSPTTDDSQTALGNMHGLTILYSCCEATGPSSSGTESFDMLTAKGLTEAYAVKLKLGVNCSFNKVYAQLSLVWVVWLYTMSHHSAIIHGCPRSLSASPQLLRAKAALEQSVDHPRIRVLLGECELCLLWERSINTPGASPATVDDTLNTWQLDWQHFLASNTAPSRQLQFHFFFTRFHLLTHLSDGNGEHRVAVAESLDAAHDFLQSMRGLSPIAKDRLRYMGDFGFVLMAYGCLYVLRALESNTIVPARRVGFLQLVDELGALMQSLGPQTNTRPSVYGVAIRSMCKQHQGTLVEIIPTSAEDGSPTQGPVGIQSLMHASQTEPNLVMPADATMVPAMLSQAEIWELDHDLSILDGLMAGIPVPEYP
ncbi:hypothetical protein ASPVEDRAFT_119842 [Aspergillus versicolor CBS 583.65]|uniref:Zn(2)-C6 fungal-type domain-containing protein n=1 Tax=Aspergillus versicolor CBS 583.65 TaxID=1036611 RepID=A0A1L9P337_ASPVE|nr:uncharacterized protein ASPVEDRAFT_119842 [Aspergillus versicolor CBS 583.65]OJI95833.1 hypothetical protein ASPVEDRAFT_119842 [Aspergillus versicolor CBS 583.65]